MPKAGRFDNDARETANRLFATTTMTLEDAAGIALVGQQPRLTAATCIKQAGKLKRVAADLAALADAILVISGKAGYHPRT